MGAQVFDDDDYDDFDPKPKKTLGQLLGEEEDGKGVLTRDGITSFAKQWMAAYFKDKPYYCGGSIPQHILFHPKRVNLVLDCTFDKAAEIAYESLEKDLTDEDLEYIEAGGVGRDIKMLISMLHGMAAEGVPQELSNGMLVLYLELCMGANVAY